MKMVSTERKLDDTVGRILKDLGYSLQAPAKGKEDISHPDRDAQFRYLNDEVTAFLRADEPVISVDARGEPVSVSVDISWPPTGTFTCPPSAEAKAIIEEHWTVPAEVRARRRSKKAGKAPKNVLAGQSRPHKGQRGDLPLPSSSALAS